MWLELKERFWEAEVLWEQEPGVLQASLLGGTPHFQVPSLLRKHRDAAGAIMSPGRAVLLVARVLSLGLGLNSQQLPFSLCLW